MSGGTKRKYSYRVHHAYDTQKAQAGCRGIEWQFDIDSWVEWWGDDFDLRGRRSLDLVMARHGDEGPYHPDNVIKCTARENHQTKNRIMNSRK